MKFLTSAHLDASTSGPLASVWSDKALDAFRETGAGEHQSGDWMEVEKTVSSAGGVDVSAVSATELELKRRVDKLSSMVTEVCTSKHLKVYC